MGISRWRLIVATLLFMCSFFLIQEDGLWRLLGFAASLFAGLVTLLHGHWQHAFSALWQIWQLITSPHKRATKQRYCAICNTPVLYKVIAEKKLVLKNPPGKEAWIACDLCGETAFYEIKSVWAPLLVGEKKIALTKSLNFICRAHHPNPAIGKLSKETNDHLALQLVAPQWVRCILYPEHIKPNADESREHYFCNDHHVHDGIGCRGDETRSLLAGIGQTWESVYPIYNDAGLFSSSGGRSLKEKD